MMRFRADKVGGTQTSKMSGWMGRSETNLCVSGQTGVSLTEFFIVVVVGKFSTVRLCRKVQKNTSMFAVTILHVTHFKLANA